MVCPSPDLAPPEPPDLWGRLQALEARVAALEALRPEPAPTRVEAGPGVPEPDTLPAGKALMLSGRACLILGGAFLIRSLTDSGTLPLRAGAALGLTYAAAWALSGHRSGLKGQGVWAAFQVFVASLIALPLLWETTVRLKALPPAFCAAALLLVTVLFVAVAVRHGLKRVAWTVVLGALVTGFSTMAATSAITAFCAFFILASGASLLFSGNEEWEGLRWPTALGVDGAGLLIVPNWLARSRQ